MVWESLGAFWPTPSGLSGAFYWGVASVWPIYHKGRICGVLQRWLPIWKFLPSSQRNSGALSEWPSGSWSPRPRHFSPDCSVWPGSWKSLGGFKLLPFKNDGGHCVLVDLQCSRMFWYSSPALYLDTILSRSSMDNSYDLMAWFLLWHALSTWDLIWTGVCLSKSC